MVVEEVSLHLLIVCMNSDCVGRRSGKATILQNFHFQAAKGCGNEYLVLDIASSRPFMWLLLSSKTILMTPTSTQKQRILLIL